MWHHSEHVPLYVRDSCDVGDRSVRIVGIREGNLPVRSERLECRLVTVVVAFPVCDRDVNRLAERIIVREHRLVRFDFQLDRLAHEFQVTVTHQHTREKPCFDEYLESVTDAEHRSPFFGEPLHFVHDW